jgi:hypothetical protein
MELMLGMQPMTTYDAMATPMYDAFTPVAHIQPYTALPPRVSLTSRNTKDTYGAKVSATMDFTRPDAAPARALFDVIAHNHK